MSNTHEKSSTRKKSSAMITTVAVLIGSFFAFAAVEAQAQVMSLAPPKRNGNQVRMSGVGGTVQFRDQATNRRGTRSFAPGNTRRPTRRDDNRVGGDGTRSVAPPRRTLSRIGGKHFTRVGNSGVTGRARRSGDNSSSFRMDRVGAGSARVD